MSFSLIDYLGPTQMQLVSSLNYNHQKQNSSIHQKQYKHAIALFMLFLFFPLTMILSIVFFIRMTQVVGFMPNKKINLSNKKKYSKELDHIAITISVFSLFNIMLLLIARDDFEQETVLLLLMIIWIILSMAPILIHFSKKYQTNSNVRNILIVFLWLQFTYFTVGSVLFIFLFLLGWYIVKKY